MDRLTEAIERRCERGRSGAAVRFIEHTAGELARAFKESLLQAVIDKSVQQHLGERRSGYQGKTLTRWPCPNCGPRLGRELRRNGHYLRRPLTAEGVICLRIPQLVCRGCKRSVPFSHPLLPRRKRLWLDLDQQLLGLYLEGCSYRAVKRLLERRSKSSIGLMSLWRSFQSAGRAQHTPPQHAPSHYLALDEVYHRVRGQPRWFLSVRGQDAEGNKHWVGSVLSSDRSTEAWETALSGLGISRYNPPFTVISDGDQAIESAVALALPGVRLQRCTWHLKHNAAEWIRERYPRKEDESLRQGLMSAVHSIVDAPGLDQRQDSLDLLSDSFPWLAMGLRRVLERIPPKNSDHPIRTNNLMERGFRELRRRTRSMDGFGSDAGAANFHHLWMLKENARVNGRDYLAEILP
ncbi:MAG: transposase [Dehalococcoidia bacterium]|nr:transposase [Dehalococcoidia bacterium]